MRANEIRDGESGLPGEDNRSPLRCSPERVHVVYGLPILVPRARESCNADRVEAAAPVRGIGAAVVRMGPFDAPHACCGERTGHAAGRRHRANAPNQASEARTSATTCGSSTVLANVARYTPYVRSLP